VLDRSDGVLVTGNLHPSLNEVVASKTDVKCQGKFRDGTHEREGVVATNDSEISNNLNIEPTDLCSVIKQFVDRNAPRPDKSDLYGIQEESDQQKVRNRLEELGYI